MNGVEAKLPLPKRLLAAFFALVLVVGLVPVSAWAEGEDAQGEAAQEQADNQGASEDVTGEGEASGSADSDDESASQGVDESDTAVLSSDEDASDEEGIVVASLTDNIVVAGDTKPYYTYSKRPSK